MAGPLSQDRTGRDEPSTDWHLAAGVRLRPEPFGGLAFAQRSGRLVVLTPQLYALLAGLPTQPKQGDAEPEAGERQNTDTPGFDDTVEAVLRRLAKSGIVVAASV